MNAATMNGMTADGMTADGMMMTAPTARRRYDSEYDEISRGHTWRRNPGDRDTEWCEGCGMRIRLRRSGDHVTGVKVEPGLPLGQAACNSQHTRGEGFFLMNGVTGRMDRVSGHDWECHGRMSRVEQAASAVPAPLGDRLRLGDLAGLGDEVRLGDLAGLGEADASWGVIAADGLAPRETDGQVTTGGWAALGNARRMEVLRREMLG